MGKLQNQLPQEVVKEWFVFDKERKLLLWKKAPSLRTKIGDPAGCIQKSSHAEYHRRRVSFKGKLYRHTVLVWNLFYGYVPEGKNIDHIDTNPLNDCPTNLRISTHEEQTCNTRGWSKRTTQLPKNIHLRHGSSFEVRIQKDKKLHNKSFPTLEEAINYRNDLLTVLHGDYKNYGRVK